MPKPTLFLSTSTVGRLLLCAALLPVLALAGCHKSSGMSPAAAIKAMMMAPVKVTVAKAVQRSIPYRLHAVGSVEPVATVTVESRVDGQLMSVDVKQGQEVKVGSPLFQLDPRTFEAALAQAQANLARDIAVEKNNAVTANEEKQLIKSHNATEQEYLLAMYTDRAQQAVVKADQAQVRNAQLQVSFCTIRSPVSGKAGALLAYAGTLVKANTTPLIVINQVKPIYVSFSLPEQTLPTVREALLHNKRLPVHVSLARGGKIAATGVLSFINNQISTSTGTITLRGTFANSNEQLWPGEYVNTELTVATIRNAVMVPTPAVQTGQQGHYVYIVQKNNRVLLKPITAGLTVGNYRVITRGLAAGATVVTDGQLQLVNGKNVVIVNKLGNPMATKAAAKPPAAATPAHAPAAAPATTSPQGTKRTSQQKGAH